jgi:hypothetical protein
VASCIKWSAVKGIEKNVFVLASIPKSTSLQHNHPSSQLSYLMFLYAETPSFVQHVDFIGHFLASSTSMVGEGVVNRKS